MILISVLIFASVLYGHITPGFANHTSELVAEVSRDGAKWKIKYTLKNNGPDGIIKLRVFYDSSAYISDHETSGDWFLLLGIGELDFECRLPYGIPAGSEVWVGTVWTPNSYGSYEWRTMDFHGLNYWTGTKVAAPQTRVGGVVVSVDKLGLLAPYIGLASTILVATVATAVYVKRVKRRKEKQ
jgi:hypothetical protein